MRISDWSSDVCSSDLSVSSTVIAATPSAAWHASRLRRRIEGAPGLGRVDQPAEPADVVLRMARGEADAQTGGAAGHGRKEDSGDIEAAIEKQLGRKDCLVCNAVGDQPNGQPASLLGRVDAIVKGVDAVLPAGLEIGRASCRERECQYG